MRAKHPPEAYMRCPGCNRQVLRANAQVIDGTLYGRECATRIRNNYRFMIKEQKR